MVFANSALKIRPLFFPTIWILAQAFVANYFKRLTLLLPTVRLCIAEILMEECHVRIFAINWRKKYRKL
jgi:hypothetical protein